MALVWDPAAVLNVASGALMGTLGAALLVADPDRDENRLFGLLAVFWGIQIVAANTVRLTTDPEMALLAGRLTLAFLIPLYFFVVSFASVFPRPRPPFGTSPLAVAALALPAAAAIVALFVDPGTLIAGIERLPSGALTLNWGPLLPYLVTAPFFGAISYALYVMSRRLDEAETSTERKQVGAVLAALGLYTAYYAPGQLVRFGAAALGLGPVVEAGRLESALIALIMAATVAILGAVVWQLTRRVRDRPQGPARSEARDALAVVAAGLAGALLVEVVAGLGGPRLELVGLFRMGSVLLIVYAIARYQLFDLDLRAKRWAAGGAGLLAAVALGTAAYVGLSAFGLDPVVQVTATTLIAAAALVPALHTSFRLANRVAPGVSEEGDHLYLRKLEVYRAAVERRLTRGEPVDRDAPELTDLRDRLGLDDPDHGVVVTLARSEAEPEEPTPSLSPGDRAFGKYELEEVIAEGGFGRVLRARDTMLGRPVVIKELLAKWRDDDAVAERFLREARIAGQLSHPNIVSVYGIEEHAGDHYIVMEHVPGGSLDERLAGGPLSVDEAVRVTRGVLSALSAAHAQDVVHRDVKPGNVLFDEEDRVKLADFGIAHLTREEPDETLAGLESRDRQPGTLAFMSPEQARGESVDPRSDVYSAGALLYRCLTGEPPVDVAGLEEFRARERIAEADLPDTAGLPDALAQALERALAPDPEDRFESAQAFLAALEEAEEQLTAA